jgi:hypothetical protein
VRSFEKAADGVSADIIKTVEKQLGAKSCVVNEDDGEMRNNFCLEAAKDLSFIDTNIH